MVTRRQILWLQAIRSLILKTDHARLVLLIIRVRYWELNCNQMLNVSTPGVRNTRSRAENTTSEKDGTGRELTDSVHSKDEMLRKSTSVDEKDARNGSRNKKLGRKAARREGRSWIRVRSTPVSWIITYAKTYMKRSVKELICRMEGAFNGLKDAFVLFIEGVFQAMEGAFQVIVSENKFYLRTDKTYHVGGVFHPIEGVFQPQIRFFRGYKKILRARKYIKT